MYDTITHEIANTTESQSDNLSTIPTYSEILPPIDKSETTAYTNNYTDNTIGSVGNSTLITNLSESSTDIQSLTSSTPIMIESKSDFLSTTISVVNDENTNSIDYSSNSQAETISWPVTKTVTTIIDKAASLDTQKSSFDDVTAIETTESPFDSSNQPLTDPSTETIFLETSPLSTTIQTTLDIDLSTIPVSSEIFPITIQNISSLQTEQNYVTYVTSEIQYTTGTSNPTDESDITSTPPAMTVINKINDFTPDQTHISINNKTSFSGTEIEVNTNENYLIKYSTPNQRTDLSSDDNFITATISIELQPNRGDSTSNFEIQSDSLASDKNMIEHTTKEVIFSKKSTLQTEIYDSTSDQKPSTTVFGMTEIMAITIENNNKEILDYTSTENGDISDSMKRNTDQNEENIGKTSTSDIEGKTSTGIETSTVTFVPEPNAITTNLNTSPDDTIANSTLEKENSSPLFDLSTDKNSIVGLQETENTTFTAFYSSKQPMDYSQVTETTVFKSDSTTTNQGKVFPSAINDNSSDIPGTITQTFSNDIKANISFNDTNYKDLSGTETLSITYDLTTENNINTTPEVIETSTNLKNNNQKNMSSAHDISSTYASMTDLTDTTPIATNFVETSTDFSQSEISNLGTTKTYNFVEVTFYSSTPVTEKLPDSSVLPSHFETSETSANTNDLFLKSNTNTSLNDTVSTVTSVTELLTSTDSDTSLREPSITEANTTASTKTAVQQNVSSTIDHISTTQNVTVFDINSSTESISSETKQSDLSVATDTSLDVVFSTASTVVNGMTLDSDHYTEPALNETKLITNAYSMDQTESSTDINIDVVQTVTDNLLSSAYSVSNNETSTEFVVLDTIEHTKELTTKTDYSSDVTFSTVLSNIENMTVTVDKKTSGTPFPEAVPNSTATDPNIIKMNLTEESTYTVDASVLDQNSLANEVTETTQDSNLLLEMSTTPTVFGQITYTTTLDSTTQTKPASDNFLVDHKITTSGSLYSESADAQTSTAFSSSESTTYKQDFSTISDTSSNTDTTVEIDFSSRDTTFASETKIKDTEKSIVTTIADYLMTKNYEKETSVLQGALDTVKSTDSFQDFSTPKTEIIISVENSTTHLPIPTSQGNLL